MAQPAAEPAPRFQPAEVRQRQILDAVARLAVERGLDNVSIAQVAAEAGIAKGSIYLHYASRSELISAVQTDLWNRMLDIPAGIASDETLRSSEKLDRLVEHWVGFEFDHHELYHAVFHAAGSDTDEPWSRSRQFLRNVIEEGSTNEEFDVIDLDVTTDFLLHAYSGPCYHSTELDRTTEVLKALFRRVVGASTEPGRPAAPNP